MSEGPGWGAAISAHRGGGEAAPAGTYEAYRDALEAGVEYVEFDVRRTTDGRLVSYHGARTPRGRAVGAVSYRRLCELAGFQVPDVTEIMRLLAGRVTGHLDLKERVDAASIVRQAIDMLGSRGFVVTTSAAPVAAELKRRFPAVPVALTFGGDLAGTTRFRWERARTPGLTRLDGVVACSADWAAVHHRTARDDVLEQCRQLGVKTLVWTVNSDRALGRWLAHPGVDVVVTDRPRHAAALRERMAAALVGTAGSAPTSGEAGFRQD